MTTEVRFYYVKRPMNWGNLKNTNLIKFENSMQMCFEKKTESKCNCSFI